MGRPYERLPAGAKRHLEAMASNCLLSESAAATALGMPLSEFRKVIVEDAKSKEIWENALAIERDNLMQALYTKAKDGDVKAAQTLLSIRHGLHEKDPRGAAQAGVSISFNLPAAMDVQGYQKAIQGATTVKEIEQ